MTCSFTSDPDEPRGCRCGWSLVRAGRSDLRTGASDPAPNRRTRDARRAPGRSLRARAAVLHVGTHCRSVRATVPGDGAGSCGEERVRVFITGSAGMLGSSVYPAFHGAGHEVVATDLTPRDVAGLPMGNLDVRDYRAVTGEILSRRPDLVLHLAAETDLEVSESNPDHAYATN